MANKTVYAVFQDCVLCGDKGRKKIAEFAEKGIEVVKVGFTTELGRELCEKAVMVHEIKAMPFFTDKTTYATRLDSFAEVEKPKRVRKKTATLKNKKAEKKGSSDGDIQEF